MQVITVTGTMPDIIKMAPVIHEGEKRGHEVIVVHSGQHNNLLLYRNQYISMGLRPPDKEFIWEEDPSDFLLQTKPDIVLVHGDTNTARVFAYASHFLRICVGHVEAGLRSGAKEPWPEQTNTRIVDACSDICFAATEYNKQCLIKEFGESKDIRVTGNTIVDVVKGMNLPYSDPKRKNKKIWFCAHRSENIFHRERMEEILKFADYLADFNEVYFVDRQRTTGYPLSSKIKRLAPMPYKESIRFMASCDLIVTDSGSIQEEAVTLGIPIITARIVTDRPESVLQHRNILGGVTLESLKEAFRACQHWVFIRSSLFGKGDASQKIWDHLDEVYSC